jgi:hypothetical protein
MRRKQNNLILGLASHKKIEQETRITRLQADSDQNKCVFRVSTAHTFHV